MDGAKVVGAESLVGTRFVAVVSDICLRIPRETLRSSIGVIVMEEVCEKT